MFEFKEIFLFCYNLLFSATIIVLCKFCCDFLQLIIILYNKVQESCKKLQEITKCNNCNYLYLINIVNLFEFQHKNVLFVIFIIFFLQILTVFYKKVQYNHVL